MRRRGDGLDFIVRGSLGAGTPMNGAFSGVESGDGEREGKGLGEGELGGRGARRIVRAESSPLVFGVDPSFSNFTTY